MAAQVLGVFLAGTGEQAEALDVFRQALAAVEASGLGERSARTEVDLRLRIGDLCTWLEQPDEAVAALEPALAAVEANPRWAGQFAVPVQMALAHAYVVADRREEGLDLYRRTIALALQERGIDGVARMLLNPVGSYALDLGLWSEVEALLEPLAAPLRTATLEGADDLRAYAFSLWVLLGVAQAHNEHLDGAERSLAEAEALIGRMAADRLPQRIRASYRDFAGMLGREARSLEVGAAPAAR
jgi:tetratricopeptide (TPR) repeat protein